VAYLRRDYFRERFTVDELSELLSGAGLSPHDALSKRSKVYQTRSTEIDAMSDAQLLATMVDEPTLIRRPLIVYEGQSVIGFDRNALRSLVERLEEEG
jgi:arsenate reductase-like glutaredoxin family protein